VSLSATLTSIVGEAGIGTLDALDGIPLARPENVEQAAELLRLVSRERLPAVFIGRGSKLGWSLLNQTPKLAVSTERLRGVLEFEPGDGVITALAGTPMDELEHATGAAGLTITPNIPRPNTGTLGGMIGAGQSGIDRTSRDAGRFHVLGTRTLQLDGDQTKSGGRLVKNVSGYDLHRLLAGSFGSLALIIEASLRLFPVPEEVFLLSQEVQQVDDLFELLAKVQQTLVEPHALLMENTGGTWRLSLCLTGRARTVEEECARLSNALPSLVSLQGSAARQELRRLRDLEPTCSHGDVLHVGTNRSHLRAALDCVLDTLGSHEGANVLCHPLVATIDLELTGRTIDAELLRSLREALKPLASQITLRRKSPLSMEFAERGTNPVRDQLQIRLRKTYDPSELLCTRPPLGV
jgi:hypothetical protein